MTSSDDHHEAHLLIGTCLDRAGGERVACERRPQAMLETLLSRQSESKPDAWALAGQFDGNRRNSDRWRAACAVVVDLDYEDPAVPKNEGAHQEMPPRYRAQLLKALDSYDLPAYAYATPRGLRIGHVLLEDVRDAESYAELADAAGHKLIRHLESCGLGTWRRGEVGLRYDSASDQPWQAMRLPIPGQPYVLSGQDRAVLESELLDGGVPRLDLDNALPKDLADSCRQVSHWVQIAPEVVVTGVMALASSAIGNSRWVEVRGLRAPLSLHYLTVQPSGSGKSEVRRYLRRVLERPMAEVSAQREKARRESEEYEEDLREWQATRRKQGGRKKAGPRPTPPPLTPRGGQRVSLIVSEGSLEGIIETLEDTPRGFLWASDEAHEILGLLGRYSDGGTGRSLDAARLRRLMDSQPVEQHRARSNASPIRALPRPWLAIDADVQPGVAQELFNHEDRRSGMTARLLIHEPPSMRGKRRYVDPPPQPSQEVFLLLRERLESLWRLDLRLDEGTPQYECINLDGEAERVWAEELERLEPRHSHANDEEAGALGHARGRVLRFAGVLALLRDPHADSVTSIDMRRAIQHMRYHFAHGRRLLCEDAVQDDEQRLKRLEEQARRILDLEPDRGVTPRELGRRVNKIRYGAGVAGFQRAVADLNALGWSPRRPPAKGRGRRPQVGWFPPGVSAKSAKGQTRGEPRQSADSAGRRSPSGSKGRPATDLLDEASARLIDSGEVALPPPGVRAPCPICGSSDGLGTIPESRNRWYCHSDRHQAGGCAVDLHLAGRLGRVATTLEAVEEAKRILGEGAAA